jgi:hypothetical protein
MQAQMERERMRRLVRVALRRSRNNFWRHSAATNLGMDG